MLNFWLTDIRKLVSIDINLLFLVHLAIISQRLLELRMEVRKIDLLLRPLLLLLLQLHLIVGLPSR